MPDESGQPDPAAVPSGDPPVQPEPSPTQTQTAEVASESYVNADGTFKEGWKEALIPEDFRGRKVYETVSDMKGLMRQLGHQAATIGRQGKGVFKPSDDATETEVDLFYEALGRPKTAEEYAFEVPEGLEAHYDAAVLADAKTAMHKAGLTQAQVDVIMALDVKRLESSLKQREEAEQVAAKACEDALVQQWGADYPRRLHLANRIIAEFATDENKHALLEIVGNSAVVADFFATAGMKLMEGGLIDSEVTSGAMTPAEADVKMKEKIEEQARDPNMQFTNPTMFKRLNEEINALAATASPTTE